MKIEIETSEETVDIINKLLILYLKDNTDLSKEQSKNIEQFRRDIIKPFAVSSKKPIVNAFAKFFGLELVNIDTVKGDTEK